MADLFQSRRISCFGGFKNEMKAYTLIGFSEEENDSCVTLVRGIDKDIPRLLKRYGFFTDEDLKRITSLGYKEKYWADENSLIIRIS